MWMINIESPEALLARQLASQRTGFAIADKGAIQSDLFPVLEYAAPRAFFLGTGSRVLWQYDERTRQQLLAPAEKAATLARPANGQCATCLQRFFHSERRPVRMRVRHCSECRGALCFPNTTTNSGANVGWQRRVESGTGLSRWRPKTGRSINRTSLESESQR